MPNLAEAKLEERSEASLDEQAVAASYVRRLSCYIEEKKDGKDESVSFKCGHNRNSVEPMLPTVDAELADVGGWRKTDEVELGSGDVLAKVASQPQPRKPTHMADSLTLRTRPCQNC